MAKISSGSTFFIKRVLPALFFGIPIGAMILALFEENRGGLWMWSVFMLTFLAVAFMNWRSATKDLVDEVLDRGDFLLVKNAGEEVKVPLADIVQIDVMPPNSSRPRLALNLLEPGRFGKRIVFSPRSTSPLNLFRPNPIAEDLVRRIDRAKRESG